MSSVQQVTKAIVGMCAMAMVIFKLFAGAAVYSAATQSLEPSTGHVVPIISHGRTIYLTLEQVELERFFHWSNLVLFAACGLLVLLSFVSIKSANKS